MTGTTKTWILEIAVLVGVGFLDGFLGVRLLSPHYHLLWPLLIGLLAMGALFELFTKKLWTYPSLIFRYPFTKDDLSMSMPVAWAGYMTLSLGIALWMENAWFPWTLWPVWKIDSVLHLLFPGPIIVFLLGNIYETFFHKSGYFYYTEDFLAHWGKRRTPWGIPVPVSIGYFWFFGLIVLNVARLVLMALNG